MNATADGNPSAVVLFSWIEPNSNLARKEIISIWQFSNILFVMGNSFFIGKR